VTDEKASLGPHEF